MRENSTCVTFRVRYAEVDQMGVAYYGNYGAWLEVGRNEYCRARGVDYREVEEEGVALVVAEMKIRYRKPLLYDDVAEVFSWVEELGPRTMTFCYEIHKEGVVCTTAYTKHVFVDMITKRPCHAPAYVVKRLSSRPGTSQT